MSAKEREDLEEQVERWKATLEAAEVLKKLGGPESVAKLEDLAHVQAKLEQQDYGGDE